jgi:rod shape-determining protein MreD
MVRPLVNRDPGGRSLIAAWPFLLIYLFLALCFFMDLIFIPGFSDMLIRPSLTLMCLFYWAIFRPTLIPFGLVFAMGLLFDATAGTYLGLHALIWMGCVWAVTMQRRFLQGQNFPMLWVIYAVIAGIVGILSGRLGISGVLTGETDTLSLFGAFLISLFFFPPIVLTLHYLHRQLPLNR